MCCSCTGAFGVAFNSTDPPFPLPADTPIPLPVTARGGDVWFTGSGTLSIMKLGWNNRLGRGAGPVNRG